MSVKNKSKMQPASARHRVLNWFATGLLTFVAGVCILALTGFFTGAHAASKLTDQQHYGLVTLGIVGFLIIVGLLFWMANEGTKIIDRLGDENKCHIGCQPWTPRPAPTMKAGIKPPPPPAPPPTRLVREDRQSTYMTHPDDSAVIRFSMLMRDRMAISRMKGKGGWDNPTRPVTHLYSCYCAAIAKGDLIDIANYAMMLQQRGVSNTNHIHKENT